MKIKHIIAWAVPIFVFVWFPFIFCLAIMNYHAHADDPFTIMFGVPCAISCFIICYKALRQKKYGHAAICCLAVVSCVFFCYWIYRIPFCTMCEPIDRSDLGFMLEPFADKFFESGW